MERRRLAAGQRRRRVGSASRTGPGRAAAATCRAAGRAIGCADGTPATCGRDEDAALRRLHAEHVETPSSDRGGLWDVIAAAIGTRRTASAAEQRWKLIKNKSAPPAAAEPPAKKRKKSEKRVEKKKKQRSRVWDLDKKKYVTS